VIIILVGQWSSATTYNIIENFNNGFGLNRECNVTDIIKKYGKPKQVLLLKESIGNSLQKNCAMKKKYVYDGMSFEFIQNKKNEFIILNIEVSKNKWIEQNKLIGQDLKKIEMLLKDAIQTLPINERTVYGVELANLEIHFYFASDLAYLYFDNRNKLRKISVWYYQE